MDILLPPKANGEQEKIANRVRQLIIIGANGSGKTRFTERLINDLSGKSFRLSALKALYDSKEQDMLPGSIDSLCSDALVASSFIRNDAGSEFERLMALLLNEEVLD